MLAAHKVLRGSAANLIRLLLTVLMATVLPPFLVRHLSQAEYSAWVLILQLGTYVNLLDLGLQTVVAKLVAEYDAAEDYEAGHRLLSSSVTMLAIVALAGLLMVGLLVWRVPAMFHEMPARLIPQVQWSLMAIGCSAALSLPFNPFVAVFNGLQEYGVPTLVALVGRLSSTVLLLGLVYLHRSLFVMAVAFSLVNLLTALAQFAAWRRYARHRIGFSGFTLDTALAKTLARSGGVIALWTFGGLLVSGFDVLIVGRFDYANTGFYAVGAMVTNLMLMIVSSLFSPLLPAVSAMQGASSAKAVGEVAIESSRYCVLILCLLALPLFVGAYPILSLWVGRSYALKSVGFLQILLLGNLVRQLGYPYSLIVIAVGRQHLATLATVAEALVNVAFSIWLASRIGALGVAYGTLLGAFVSVGLHLTVSMRFTRPAIDFPVPRFLVQSLLRPMSCLLPTAALLLVWRRDRMWPASPVVLLCWFVATLGLALVVGLTAADKKKIQVNLSGLHRRLTGSTAPATLLLLVCLYRFAAAQGQTTTLNATQYPGQDIGMQVNAAIQALPAMPVAYPSDTPQHCGTVEIPARRYQQTTTILKPNCVILEGNGAQLIYRGSHAAVIEAGLAMKNQTFANSAGGIHNLWLNGGANLTAGPTRASGYAGLVLGGDPDGATPGDFGAYAQTNRDLHIEGFQTGVLIGRFSSLDTFVGGTINNNATGVWYPGNAYGSGEAYTFLGTQINNNYQQGILDQGCGEFRMFGGSIDYTGGVPGQPFYQGNRFAVTGSCVDLQTFGTHFEQDGGPILNVTGGTVLLYGGELYASSLTAAPAAWVLASGPKTIFRTFGTQYTARHRMLSEVQGDAARSALPGPTSAEWTTGSTEPSSQEKPCSTGSLYSNTSGHAGSTLWVCVEGRWVSIR